jgi:peptidoglycan/LPS O-acetylase OafA/YrhL
MTIETEAQIKGQIHEVESLAPSDSPSPLNFARRIPELDGMRGMAIIVCLFFHYVTIAIVARPPELLGYVHTTTRILWAGVDLFFVLSGFLIGGILLDARTSPNYFSTFYIRRFCRILPIFFLFSILVGIAYHFVYPAFGAPVDWIFAGNVPWYANLSFAQNFWMAKLNTVGPPILAITWSLAVEEQFYLALPIIIRFVRRSALPYVFIAGIIIAPLLRLFLIHRFRDHLWATYVLLPCRMDSLLLGALCAYSVREPGLWSRLVKGRNTMWVVFFALLAGMPLLNSKGIPFTLLYATVGYGWMSLFFATVLMLALTDSQSLISRVMRVKWLASLGEIGYSVYLFHLGIYCFCMWLLTTHGWLLASWKDFGVTLLAAAITITFAKLSWVYFERPIVRWGHRWKYETRGQTAIVTSGSALQLKTGDSSKKLQVRALYESHPISEPLPVRASITARSVIPQ